MPKLYFQSSLNSKRRSNGAIRRSPDSPVSWRTHPGSHSRHDVAQDAATATETPRSLRGRAPPVKLCPRHCDVPTGQPSRDCLVCESHTMSAQQGKVRSKDIRCGHPKYASVPCFDDSVKKHLVIKAGRTAVLQCIIYNAKKKAVTWDKKDTGPIAIDDMIFIRDSRYSVRRGRTTDWSLVIASVRPTDSGIYRCQINTEKIKEKVFTLKVEEPERKMLQQTEDNRPRKPPNSSTDEYLKDQGSETKLKSVFITGKDMVYTGGSMRLSCTARYRNPMRDDAVIEWYHYGIHKTTSREELLTIRLQIINSTTLVSYLHLDPVTKAYSGPWVCVKRPSEKRNREREASKINITVIQPVYTVQGPSKAVGEENVHNASSPLSPLVRLLVLCSQYLWLRLHLLDGVM